MEADKKKTFMTTSNIFVIKVSPFQLYADYIYNRIDAVEYTYMPATPFLRVIISHFFSCNKGFFLKIILFFNRNTLASHKLNCYSVFYKRMIHTKKQRRIFYE